MEEKKKIMIGGSITFATEMDNAKKLLEQTNYKVFLIV